LVRGKEKKTRMKKIASIRRKKRTVEWEETSPAKMKGFYDQGQKRRRPPGTQGGYVEESVPSVDAEWGREKRGEGRERFAAVKKRGHILDRESKGPRRKNGSLYYSSKDVPKRVGNESYPQLWQEGLSLSRNTAWRKVVKHSVFFKKGEGKGLRKDGKKRPGFPGRDKKGDSPEWSEAEGQMERGETAIPSPAVKKNPWTSRQTRGENLRKIWREKKEGRISAGRVRKADLR